MGADAPASRDRRGDRAAHRRALPTRPRACVTTTSAGTARGYPDRLAGEEISLEARVVAVADAYSAITSRRPYQRERSRDEAIEELRASAGGHLDPKVVDALCRVLRMSARQGGDLRAAAAACS